MPAWRYVVLLLGTALVCGPGIYLATWAHRVVGCRTTDRAGTFLAYCEQPAYGSYEHEAYAFDLEPESVAALRRARVLFLGNSRLQMGFSTPQVTAFFQARDVPYHLLGFGYGESSLFPHRLLARLRLDPQFRPAAVVINADPFFADTLSSPGYDIARKPWGSRADGWMKRLFGQAHPLLCRMGLCAQAIGATYRDHRTGQWIWQDVLIPRDTVAMAITARKAGPWSEADLPAWQRTAEYFIADLGLPRACVILTAIPTPAIDAEAMATALARRLGTPLVLPDVPGLTASDNSHLSADSAERWSAAFMAQAAPLIDACLAPRTN